jgi:hypothetical protein
MLRSAASIMYSMAGANAPNEAAGTPPEAGVA